MEGSRRSCRLSATKSMFWVTTWPAASLKVRCCWIGHGNSASSANSGMGSGLLPKPWKETKGEVESGFIVLPSVVGEGRWYIGSSGLMIFTLVLTRASISMAVIETSPSPCAPCTSPMPMPQPSTKHSITSVLPTVMRCESSLP